MYKKHTKRKFIKTPITQHSIGIILNLGSLLGVHLKKSKVIRDLASHSDYPSVLATSDTLTSYGINNQGLILEKDSLHEQILPLVCMVTDATHEASNVIVTSVQNDAVEYLDPSSGYITEPIDVFTQKWNGIALVIEPPSEMAKMQQPKSMAMLFYQRLVFIVPFFIALSSILTFIFQGFFVGAILSVLYTFAIYLSFSLVHEELDNDFIESFCSRFFSNGCLSVINSKPGLLVPYLKLSEIGLLYYVTTAMLLSIFSVLGLSTDVLMVVVCITSFAGVIFSFISFYYQVKVLDIVCIPCNLISLLNWLIFILAFTSVKNISAFHVEWSHVVLIAIFYVTGILFAVIVRNWVNLSLVTRDDEVIIKNIFTSSWFFPALESNSEKEKNPIDLNELVFGDIHSKDVVRLVVSPYCWVSKRLYTMIRQAHVRNQIDCRVELRMATLKFGAYQSIIDTIIYQRFIFTTESNEEKQARFDACYASQIHDEPQRWMDNPNPEAGYSDSVQEKITMLKNWLEENNITKAPTLISNGTIIPNVFLMTYMNAIVLRNSSSQ